MASVSSESNLVAARYAVALLDMAAEAKAVEKVEKDLLELAAMIDGSADLQGAIRNPLISREQQGQAMSALADKAKFQGLTKNFLGVSGPKSPVTCCDSGYQSF